MDHKRIDERLSDADNVRWTSCHFVGERLGHYNVRGCGSCKIVLFGTKREPSIWPVETHCTMCTVIFASTFPRAETFLQKSEYVETVNQWAYSCLLCYHRVGLAETTRAMCATCADEYHEEGAHMIYCLSAMGRVLGEDVARLIVGQMILFFSERISSWRPRQEQPHGAPS
jgi:hypothetical protein